MREIRCEAPHPKVRGWSCRARIADVAGAVEVVEQGGPSGPGDVRVVCWRCGTAYLMRAIYRDVAISSGPSGPAPDPAHRSAGTEAEGGSDRPPRGAGAARRKA